MIAQHEQRAVLYPQGRKTFGANLAGVGFEHRRIVNEELAAPDADPFARQSDDPLYQGGTRFFGRSEHDNVAVPHRLEPVGQPIDQDELPPLQRWGHAVTLYPHDLDDAGNDEKSDRAHGHDEQRFEQTARETGMFGGGAFVF